MDPALDGGYTEPAPVGSIWRATCQYLRLTGKPPRKTYLLTTLSKHLRLLFDNLSLAFERKRKGEANEECTGGDNPDEVASNFRSALKDGSGR